MSITIPSTIEMDVAPTTSGTFTSTTSTLSITTNNPSGYDLYLSAADGDNALRNENPSVQNTKNTINPTTNGVTSTTMSNNTWGYNLSGGSSTQTPDTYNAVPKDGTTALDSTTAPSTTNYNLTFGAKVDTSIASGTYSSEVIISAVAKPVLITINFDGNGATSGSMPSIQIPAGEQRQLPANVFTRTEYNFAGWNTEANGNGTHYDDKSTYLATDQGLTATLYAQWDPPYEYIQTFANSQCETLASDNNYYVVDQRDNNVYTVRYINGACWMTQNLRLAGGTQLNSTTSNVSSNYTLPADSTASDTFLDNDGSVHYSGNTNYGSYYDLCAASAGTRCNFDSSDDSENDICPKGWRLPTRSEMNGITGTSYVSAFSPVCSGYYYGGSLGSTGSRGYWWSATANVIGLQYNLYYHDGSLYINYYSKSSGRSVRCVRSS